MKYGVGTGKREHRHECCDGGVRAAETAGMR